MNNFNFIQFGFNQKILNQYFLQQFGFNSCSKFLQEIMFLGFEYSTNYSLSLNLELCKGYNILGLIFKKFKYYKNSFFFSEYKNYYTKLYKVKKKSKKSLNKFFELITIYTKFNKIINFLNLSYLTSARSNLEQIKQLIFFRGYISNSRGYLYELPIIQNFTHGLNLYEFFLSCYGSRKGILDTSLNIADSGYLTRRLVEIIQDISIKENNCFTNSVFLYYLKHNTRGILNYPNKLFIKGKNIGQNIYCKNKGILLLLKNKKIKNFKILKLYKNKLSLKSIFLCLSGRYICNLCFGVNSKFQNNINQSLGIISGESIGEPSTQLTLRTFHTGGIFSKNKIKNKINLNLITINKYKKKIKYKFNKIIISINNNKKNLNLFIKKYINNYIKIIKAFNLKQILNNIYFLKKNFLYNKISIKTLKNIFIKLIIKNHINNTNNTYYIKNQPIFTYLPIKLLKYINNKYIEKNFNFIYLGQLLFINNYLLFINDYNYNWKFEIIKSQFIFQKYKNLIYIQFNEGLIFNKLKFFNILSFIKKKNFTLYISFFKNKNLIFYFFNLFKYLVLHYKYCSLIYKKNYIIKSYYFFYYLLIKKKNLKINLTL